MSPTHAKLLLRREDAARKIGEQIEKGFHIVNLLKIVHVAPHDLHQDAPLNKAEAEREKWAKFTVHLLSTLFDNNSVAREFGETWFEFSEYGGALNEQFEKWMQAKIVRLESIKERLNLYHLAEKPVSAATAPAPPKQPSRGIFVVHGHDNEAKQAVARLIEKLNLHAIILHEQPDKGRTVIEKFEHHSTVGFAVVLLTPDDMGYPRDTPSEIKPRARQNVVLELGYFIGILGRSKVCALLKGAVEIPSDYLGVITVPMDDAGAWQFNLAREIKAAGIDLDLNRLK